MGRDERPKRGLEALADPQDQGATVKKKKERRMSREAANLGTTAHEVRNQTGRNNTVEQMGFRPQERPQNDEEGCYGSREDGVTSFMVGMGRLSSLA